MAPSLKEHSSFSLFLRPRHGNKKQASQTHQTFDPQNKKKLPRAGSIRDPPEEPRAVGLLLHAHKLA